MEKERRDVVWFGGSSCSCGVSLGNGMGLETIVDLGLVWLFFKEI